MSTLEVAQANERLAELHIPGARIAEVPGAHELRWRAYAAVTFSVDGTLDNTFNSECLLATGYTAAEVLEKCWEFSKDPHRQQQFHEHGRNRHLRGLPLADEPLPETPEQQARSAAQAEKLRIGRQRMQEGMRKHLVGMLKAQGLYDVAKKYSKKTGRMRALFGGKDWFDFGRRG